jgi:hypothetical protein
MTEAAYEEFREREAANMTPATMKTSNGTIMAVTKNDVSKVQKGHKWDLPT